MGEGVRAEPSRWKFKFSRTPESNRFFFCLVLITFRNLTMIYKTGLALVVSLLLSAVSGAYFNGTCAPGSRFKVGNGVWTGCNGAKFIPRGINLQYGDNPSSALSAIGAIGQTGANAVRIQLRSFTTGAQIKQALDACLSNNMVAILMLWDSSTTCGTDTTSLFNMISLWDSADWKSVIQNEEYAPYILLNPINEWSASGGTTRQQFRDAYIQVIQKMRGYGYTNSLSLNGYHCGQYPDSFTYYMSDTGKSVGQSLLDADNQHNILFGLHGYSTYWQYASNIDTNIQNLMSAGQPWLITEHGCTYASGSDQVDHMEFWKKTAESGIGVFAWSWHGNGNPALDMSSSYSPFSASAYGKDIVYGTYGIQATSHKFGGSSGGSVNTPAPTHAPTSGGSSSGCANALYGQCGGSGWSGATCCPSGSSCQTQNQWYSQCVGAAF
jgi:mannan endo-1,4-beta-mannosidase